LIIYLNLKLTQKIPIAIALRLVVLEGAQTIMAVIMFALPNFSIKKMSALQQWNHFPGGSSPPPNSKPYEYAYEYAGEQATIVGAQITLYIIYRARDLKTHTHDTHTRKRVFYNDVFCTSVESARGNTYYIGTLH